MVSLHRKQRGFTIVELLIVIIVIGILATLVLVTFTGVQQKARNTQRQTDIKAVASHLEAYNANNAEYPTLANMNDAAWVAANLKGLDKESTRDPNGTLYTFAGSSTSNQYGYGPTKSDGTACDNTTGNECAKFTLTYSEEGGAQKTVNSLQ
ncbi:MAG TPA: prepilin-type N-terminal cleavage/methylation domain-containing protein [Candidatus Saccharimonadales bacterium]|nr:prepilin-type N-terminal cleavage/methylation domain-containing protein [Candidatus Saccharimonadales bacterium]